ncbi:MAG: thioredoxin family protein [Candidatus Micrarchaeota archaeon]
MKPAFTVFFAFILLLGCSGQQPLGSDTKNETSGASEPNETNNFGGSGVDESNEMSGLDTNSISFSRDASDVVNTETEFPKIPEFDFSGVRNGEGKLIVNFFYSPYCVASQAIMPEIDRLEGAYPGAEFRRFDISTQNGTWAYLDFAEQFNLSSEKRLVPQVLVDGKIITDRFNINESLEGILQAQ